MANFGKKRGIIFSGDLTTCGNNQFQCPGTSQCEDAGTSGGVCDGENDCGDYTGKKRKIPNSFSIQ